MAKLQHIFGKRIINKYLLSLHCLNLTSFDFYLWAQLCKRRIVAGSTSGLGVWHVLAGWSVSGLRFTKPGKKFSGIGAFSENSLIPCPGESGQRYAQAACGQSIRSTCLFLFFSFFLSNWVCFSLFCFRKKNYLPK